MKKNEKWAGAIIAAALGLGGAYPMSRGFRAKEPPKPKEKTQADYDRIEKARLKQERREQRKQAAREETLARKSL